MPTTETPNYRYVTVRLLDKIRRNLLYYRANIASLERKSKRQNLEESARTEATTRCDSLRRCAADLEFIYDHATRFITSDDVTEITNFDRQEFYDRHNSVSQSDRPGESGSPVHQRHSSDLSVRTTAEG